MSLEHVIQLGQNFQSSPWSSIELNTVGRLVSFFLKQISNTYHTKKDEALKLETGFLLRFTGSYSHQTPPKVERYQCRTVHSV